MARIRSIKPEFWTSEQVVECSTTARLLFIGMWTFADDGGNFPESLKRLKMQVFPADDISTTNLGALVEELQNNDLLTHYVVDGKGFYHINGWSHQRIDKPTYRFPQFNNSQKQLKNRRALDDQSNSYPVALDHGEEGRGEDIDNKKPCPPEANGNQKKVKPKAAPDWLQTIIDSYEATMPRLPAVIVSLFLKNKTSMSKAKARWDMDSDHQSREFWDWFFQAANRNPWWNGESYKPPGLIWFLESAKFDQVVTAAADYDARKQA